MDDSRYSLPYVSQDTENYDEETEISEVDMESQDNDMTSPPHTQDTESSRDNRMPNLNREAYMKNHPHYQDTDSYGYDKMPSLVRETDMTDPPNNQDTESSGDNEMPSLDVNETDTTSSERSDQDTEIYDLDTEMSSKSSEEDRASDGTKETLDFKKLAKDCDTETASEGHDMSWDERKNKTGSSCSTRTTWSTYEAKAAAKQNPVVYISNETQKTDVSASGKNKNEVSSKNNLVENDLAIINNADRYSPVCNSNIDWYSSKTLFEILVCDNCYHKFSDREQLYDHNTIPSPLITYSCEVCYRSFSIECSFERHKLFDHIPELFSPEKQI